MFVVIALVAVSVTGYMYRDQRRELHQVRTSYSALEMDNRIRTRIIEFLTNVDFKSEDESLAVGRARKFISTMAYLPSESASRQTWETKPKLFSLDPESGLEILSFANDYHVVPGHDTSLTVVFHQGKFVDMLFHEVYTRKHRFKTRFTDLDGDGREELWFDGTPPEAGFAYTISESGIEPFVRNAK